MPQPFLPTFKDKNYIVGFECINERPKFEGAIGRCIAIWAYVDNGLGGLFGILLKNESAAAHSVFLVLRRWSNQRQALDATANTMLSGDTIATYKALMDEYGSLESQRNDLAHSCFGICPEDDDLLFMIKVEHHVVWQADILPKLDAGTYSGSDPHQGLKENMYVYRMADLERLYSQMKQLRWDIVNFNAYLRHPERSECVALFQQLFSEPRIQQRIAALK
ncbi:MAG TPA: hypothetical protein VIH87_00500 [Methylocella sp.]